MQIQPLKPGKLLRAIDSGASIVTATARLAREIQHDYDQHQMDQGKTAWPSAQVLSWSAWTQELWQNHGDVERTLIGSQHLQALWSTIIEQQLSRGDDASSLWNVSATAKQAISAWELAQNWHIPIEPIRQSNHLDHQQFAAWAAKYANTLQANRWIDLSGVLAYLTQHPPQLTNPVIVVGYDLLDPSQAALLEALQSGGTETMAARVVTNQTPETTRYDFDDPPQEWAHIADWARGLLQTQRETDPDKTLKIGIVTPDIEPLRHTIKTALRDCLTPGAYGGTHYSDAPFHISLGLPLSKAPMIQAALQALSLFDPVPYATISQLLLSPYFSFDLSALERAQLDDTLKRRARYELNLESLAFISHRNTAFQKTINRLISHYQLSPTSQVASAWANFFTEILDLLKWTGAGSLSSEEFQTQEAWRKVLQNFAQLDITQDTLSLGTAVSTLRRLCDQTLFQPEANPNAPIEIMGVLEAGGLQFDYLWLAGFNESAWPVPTNINAFIPAYLQREAGIPLVDIDRQYAINQQRFARLVEAAPQVVMSYARHIDGVTILPSSAIADMTVSPVADNIKPLSTLIREQRPSLEWWIDESGLPVTNGVVSGGTQAMADQAACPFRAYARHRLSARIEPDPEPGIDSMERGSLIHKILASLWTQLKTQQALHAVHDRGELGDLIQSVVNPLVAEVSKQSGLGNTFCRSQQQRICALIDEWLSLELQRQTPFEVKAVEQRIEAFEIGGISLNIALDRLDQLGSDSGQQCFGVMDYKTGSGLDINQWSDERIEQPQLPLYALHVDEKIGPLGAVLYGQVRPNESAFIGVSIGQDMLPGVNTVEANARKKFGVDFREWANLIPSWRERLETTAEALARGDAGVDPKTSNSCQYCDLGSFCRIEQHTGELDQEIEIT